jgi:MFS family permease
MIARQTLRALAHRNFRLFFAGQSVSLVGTWMQQVAMAWLVYELTGSAWWLGVVGFAGQVPSLFVSPVAGVLVDRHDRRRTVLLTQTLAMLQAFALAALELTGAIRVWHVVALGGFIGLVNAVDMPARQAFLTEMVPRREDLGNAIALNSSMFNGARLVGPALAALVLARAGAGVCFLLNGLSFLAVLASLAAMRVPPRDPEARPRGPLGRGLREGFAYAFGFAPIRSLLLLLAVVSTAGMAYQVLLPVVATELLGGREATYGLLTAASGVGALAAAVYLASRHSVLGLGKWVAGAPALLGAGVLAVSFCTRPGPALPLAALTGFAMMIHMAASNTILQTIVDEDKRGRVMSLYTMAFLGTAPVGSLAGGALAARYGVEVALRCSAAVGLAGAAAFALYMPRLRALVRPIYVRLGILPGLSGNVPGDTPVAAGEA